jgi:hypothetical protein
MLPNERLRSAPPGTSRNVLSEEARGLLKSGRDAGPSRTLVVVSLVLAAVLFVVILGIAIAAFAVALNANSKLGGTRTQLESSIASVFSTLGAVQHETLALAELQGASCSGSYGTLASAVAELQTLVADLNAKVELCDCDAATTPPPSGMNITEWIEV